jgi:hypothetical protein
VRSNSSCSTRWPCAPDGLTTFELAEITGRSRITISPRMAPLTHKGLVVDSGERRQGDGDTRA